MRPFGPPQPDMFSPPAFSPHRRHTPYFGSPDYRIFEMNKRLQQRTEVDKSEQLKTDLAHTIAECQ